MKFTFTLSAIVVFSFSSAQITLNDDGLHFAVGGAISSGTYAFVYAQTKNKK